MAPIQQVKSDQKTVGRKDESGARQATSDLIPDIKVHLWEPVNVELVLDSAQSPDASQRVSEWAHILLKPLV